MRRQEPRTSDVGRLTGLGGSLEISTGAAAVHVRWMCYEAQTVCFGVSLRRVGLEETLRGQGAQVHWEMALALQARSQGNRLR